MTVIAGFKVPTGTVLLADTQETVAHAKRYVPKLRVEPNAVWKSAAEGLGGFKQTSDDLAVAFCGAGDGPFIDKLVDLSWKACCDAKDPLEACARVEETIQNTYERFGQIYQPGYCPTVDLIYSVKMNGIAKLFQATGPVVNEKDDYCTNGIGSYMADFIASRMYNPQLSIQQCVILAAYILFHTKEHVEGCGGESHIAVLRTDGTSGLVNERITEAITKNLQMADRNAASLLLSVADLTLNAEEFKTRVDALVEVLQTLRAAQSDDVRKAHRLNYAMRAFYGLESEELDEFGLAKLSESQANEQGRNK